MPKPDIIYTNGDSFVAGVELGDDILPDYPGLCDFQPLTACHDHAREWIVKTYDPKHPYYQFRQKHTPKLLELEYLRSFPSKLSKATDILTINMAMGGASMDRIVRKSLSDLMYLNKKYKNIVALIGTTIPCRSEIPSSFPLGENFLKEHTAWECVSMSYKTPNRSATFDKIYNYKLEMEKNYHHCLNFLKNIILLEDFCKLNGIILHWICTNDTLNNYMDNIEKNYRDLEDLNNFYKYADFKSCVYMKQIAEKINYNVLCPSGHYSEIVHDHLAKILIDILKG